MKNFNEYANFYDSYYSAKNYAEEVNYVIELTKKHGINKFSKVLDLGCGTGTHILYLAERGYKVKGIDLSNEMISFAKKKIKDKKIETVASVQAADIRNFRSRIKYDLVISMFAVMGYLNTNEEFIAGLKTAAAHMHKNSIFIFDVWFGPTVLSILPETRIQEFEMEGKKVFRLVRPVVDELKQVVNIKYDLISIDKNNNSHLITEVHSMRYFFIQELAFLLKEAGMKLIKVYPFMETSREPKLGDWNISVISKLKK